MTNVRRALRSSNLQTQVQNQNANPHVIVQSSGLDNHVPTVQRVNKLDVKAHFRTQHLTPIEGVPIFEQMQHLKNELASNALAAKVGCGGGKKRCLRVVYGKVKYRIEVETDLVVLATQGAYPYFQANATDNNKKKAIAKFLHNEYNIQVVEIIKDILKNMLTGAINKDFTLGLKVGVSEYIGCTLIKIIEHL